MAWAAEETGGQDVGGQGLSRLVSVFQSDNGLAELFGGIVESGRAFEVIVHVSQRIADRVEVEQRDAEG
jgi:hypothetical protein